MHMKQSTSSHIHPIYDKLLCQDQGYISVTLAFQADVLPANIKVCMLATSPS